MITLITMIIMMITIITVMFIMMITMITVMIAMITIMITMITVMITMLNMIIMMIIMITVMITMIITMVMGMIRAVSGPRRDGDGGAHGREARQEEPEGGLQHLLSALRTGEDSLLCCWAYLNVCLNCRMRISLRSRCSTTRTWKIWASISRRSTKIFSSGGEKTQSCRIRKRVQLVKIFNGSFPNIGFTSGLKDGLLHILLVIYEQVKSTA